MARALGETFVEQSESIAQADCSAAKLGTSIAPADIGEPVAAVTLNAPTQKGSLSLGYGAEDRPFNGEVRVRYNNEFPVLSGVYVGTACIVGGTAPTVSVASSSGSPTTTPSPEKVSTCRPSSSNWTRSTLGNPVSVYTNWASRPRM